MKVFHRIADISLIITFIISESNSELHKTSAARKISGSSYVCDSWMDLVNQHVREDVQDRMRVIKAKCRLNVENVAACRKLGLPEVNAFLVASLFSQNCWHHCPLLGICAIAVCVIPVPLGPLSSIFNQPSNRDTPSSPLLSTKQLMLPVLLCLLQKAVCT